MSDIAEIADIDKLYLTNRAALFTKYGDGADAVISALQDLVKDDAIRGFESGIGLLDEPVGTITPVISVDDYVTTKVAVDEWFNATEPDYLVLVGGPDVICFQPMDNPMGGDQDTDTDIPSDLPYACPGSPSRTIARFVGPDRVVGRLPDMPKATDPEVLLTIIKAAIAGTPPRVPTPEDVLAVSAERWSLAAKDLLKIGAVGLAPLRTVPAEGPSWTDAELAQGWHVFSCHGAAAASTFWGEQACTVPLPPAHDAPLPPALDASHLVGKLEAGTVCITGCCYGAELYDPVLAGGAPGIWHAYLSQQAAAYIGSTCLAYGQDENAYGCDEFCGYILAATSNGASIGRALLDARHRFVAANPVLAPEQQKTLAQFVLFGDPSVHPGAASDHLTAGTALERSPRRDRRAAIAADAMKLREATRPTLIRAGANARRHLADASSESELIQTALTEAGFQDAVITRFVVPAHPGATGPRTRSLKVMAVGVNDGLASLIDEDDSPAQPVVHMTLAIRQVSRGRWEGFEGLRVTQRSDGTIEEVRFASR